jgi:hypothetical protein
MPDSYTAKLNLTKPEVGASTDTWGTKINSDLDSIDGLFETGPYLKIAKGGTAAGTAADARTNLGVPGIATTNNFTEAQTITLNTSTSGLKVAQSGAGAAIELNAGELVAGHTAPLAGISGATGVLQVNGTEGYQHASWSTSAGASVQFLRSRATTPGTQTAVQENDVISSVKFAGSDGTGFIPAAEIRVAVDGTPGTNDMPGRIAFYTTADGASSVTERLRIDKSGAFGIAGANYGTSGQVLVSAGSSAAVSWADKISRDTSIATTSGTAHGFTTIPTWAKKITVVLDGVSTNGTSRVQLQLGTGGSYVTTGYQASSANVFGSDRTSVTTSTTGFVHEGVSATTLRSGTFTLFNITGNTWVSTHVFGDSAVTANPGNIFGGGKIALSGAIDRLRITTVNGTDTFDAGNVNVFYE